MKRILLPVAALALSACQLPGPSPRAARTYTLVQILTGAQQGMPAPEQQRVFTGHFANMERLAAAGDLVVAGPYGSQRVDPELRGIFLLDTSDRAAAQQIAETDPGFEAGVFRFEYSTFETSADLPAYVRAERRYRERAQARGQAPKPGENGRGYVWLTAEHWEHEAMSADLSCAVVLAAALEDGRHMVLLDALTRAEAERRVQPIAWMLGEHHLDEWFGSKLLLQALAPPSGP